MCIPHTIENSFLQKLQISEFHYFQLFLQLQHIPHIHTSNIAQHNHGQTCRTKPNLLQLPPQPNTNTHSQPPPHPLPHTQPHLVLVECVLRRDVVGAAVLALAAQGDAAAGCQLLQANDGDAVGWVDLVVVRGVYKVGKRQRESRCQ